MGWCTLPRPLERLAFVTALPLAVEASIVAAADARSFANEHDLGTFRPMCVRALELLGSPQHMDLVDAE